MFVNEASRVTLDLGFRVLAIMKVIQGFRVEFVTTVTQYPLSDTEAIVVAYSSNFNLL